MWLEGKDFIKEEKGWTNWRSNGRFCSDLINLILTYIKICLRFLLDVSPPLPNSPPLTTLVGLSKFLSSVVDWRGGFTWISLVRSTSYICEPCGYCPQHYTRSYRWTICLCHLKHQFKHNLWQMGPIVLLVV